MESNISRSTTILFALLALMFCGCAETIDSPLEFAELARLHERAGDEAAAIQAYQLSLELREDDAPLWWDLGRAYDRIEDFEQAVSAYSRAIEFDETLVAAFENRGRAFLKLNRIAGNRRAPRQQHIALIALTSDTA